MLFLKIVVACCCLALTLGATTSPSIKPTSNPTSARGSYFSISAFAGQGSGGYGGNSGNEGMATSASINKPYGIWQDTVGAVYFSDYNNACIRKVDTANIMTSVAGQCGTSGSSGDSGKATAALLYQPKGIFVTTTGILYLADYSNYKVRAVSTSGIITTYAGNGDSGDTSNSVKATSTSFYRPYSVWGNTIGVIYVGRYYQVNQVSTSAMISTLAGKLY